MTVLNKACFVLSATSRLSGRRLLPLLLPRPSTLLRAPTTTVSPTRMVASSGSSSAQDSRSDTPGAGGAAAWPTPAAFNALSHSSRSKVYCDFGDAGKMTWKPHEEPPKVWHLFWSGRYVVCVVSNQSIMHEVLYYTYHTTII